MVMTNGASIKAAERNPRHTSEGISLGRGDAGHREQQHGESGYGLGVWSYRDAGWPGVLPLPPGEKSPPPKGYTGYDGKWPTADQIEEWIALRPPNSNLMLRVGHGVIGIDVDAYDNKKGGQALEEAEARWGPIPSTFRSSARSEDEVSGVRLFRVPQGVLFCTAIQFDGLNLGDIEIVQPHHRYVTAWPSIHPKTGQRYRWWGPDGVVLPEGQVPRVQDLAELPQTWIDALSKDALRHEVFNGSAPNRPRACDAAVDEEVYERLTHLVDNGVPDEVVAATLQRALLELTGGSGSRYDTTLKHVAALMRHHYSGRRGVPSALAQLFPTYVLEVSDTRPREVAEAEFWRLTEGAALRIAATAPSDPWETLGTADPASVEGQESHSDAGGDGPSWSPVDLTALINGVHEPLVPSLFERSDGQCLLYPGLVHSFHGDPLCQPGLRRPPPDN
jgi:hypothetical protein